MSDRPRVAAPWLVPTCGGVAFLAPFVVAMLHVGVGPTWRGDLPLLRGLAWLPAGALGRVWPLLVQGSYFLPLGSIPFRAGVVSALVLGCAGVAVFRIARELLSANADMPRLGAVLATIAALVATLHATGQREGATIGGASLALLLALLVLAARPAESLTLPQRGFAVGTVLAVLASESPVVALALLFATAGGLAATGLRPTRGTLLATLIGATLTGAWLTLPSIIRPFAPHPFLDLSRGVGALGAPPFEAESLRWGGASLFVREVGWGSLFFALVGGAVGVLRVRLRSLTVPLIALIVMDLFVTPRPGLVRTEDAIALHLLAMAALSIGVALGIHAIVTTLIDLELPMARGASVFVVMTSLTLAAATAEEGWFAWSKSSPHGAEVFTDEAWLRFPERGVLLVRSKEAAVRLWSARLVEGARPDVLLIPTPLFGDPRLATGLLSAEPSLQQMLRDLSLEGRAGEEALTILSDTRTVLTELDPRWEKRIVSHLVPDQFWLRFAPQPLGPSDRRAAFADVRARFDRVLLASSELGELDPELRAMLRARMTDVTVEAAMLGDREDTVSLLERLLKVTSGDRFATELTQRLSVTKAGAIDVKGLLR